VYARSWRRNAKGYIGRHGMEEVGWLISEISVYLWGDTLWEMLEYVFFMFVLCVIWNSQADMTFSTALMIPNVTCSIAIKKLMKFGGGEGGR
jgi:hypothetical protein